MGIPRTSGSNFHRTVACPGSAALPRIDEEKGEPANKGTEIHKFLENCLTIGREQALKKVPNKYINACLAIDISLLPAGQPEAWSAEVIYAYNWKTGESRVIQSDVPRAQWNLGDFEIPSVSDVNGFHGDTIWTYDYKTGRKAVEPAISNYQLKLLGISSAIAFGKPKARVGIIQITDESDPLFDHAEFDEFDMAMIQGEIRQVMEKAQRAVDDFEAGKMPKLSVGSHCTYCPAARICPARTELVKAFLDDPSAITGDAARGVMPVYVVSPEEAGKAYTAIVLMLESLKLAKGAIEQIVESGIIIPLPNGKVLAPVINSRELVIGSKVLEVATSMYGAEKAEKAVRRGEVESTKGMIKEFLKTVIRPGQTQKDAFEKFMRALRIAGGTNPSSYPKVKEIDVKQIKSQNGGEVHHELPEREEGGI